MANKLGIRCCGISLYIYPFIAQPSDNNNHYKYTYHFHMLHICYFSNVYIIYIFRGCITMRKHLSHLTLHEKKYMLFNGYFVFTMFYQTSLLQKLFYWTNFKRKGNRLGRKRCSISPFFFALFCASPTRQISFCFAKSNRDKTP